MQSLVDEVKDKLDIVDIVSGYVKMSPAGSNMRGLCPFHREKTPSFMVSKEKQIFHCFGCDKGGDVITFIQEIEGMEFKEALNFLVEKAGLEPRKWQGTGMEKQISDDKETLRRVLETTAAYYQENLKGQEGKRARDYLLGRGLTGKSLENFRLGYSLARNKNGAPSALFEHLRNLGFSSSAILASGSVYKKDNSDVYVDRFRERIIFPIADSLGRIVGFSARLLPGSDSTQGKYINTPATTLYDKGSLFYGFHLAKKAIRESGEAILLEGNLDVVLSHQANICQTVASCGTALGKKQLVFLRRYTKRLVLAFDADMAGVKATKRSAELAWEEDFDVKTIPLKTGKDVADVVQADHANWRKMVKKKKSVAGFFFDLAFKGRILDLDQKKVLADKIVKLLAAIPEKVEQSYYLRLLAEEVQVPEEHLWEKIKALKTNNYGSKGRMPVDASLKAINSSEKKNRRTLLEERLIGLIYNFPKLYFKHFERVERCVFSNPETGHLFQEIRKRLDSLSKDQRNQIKNADYKLENRNLFLTVSKIALDVEKELGEDPDENLEKAEEEIKTCLLALEKEFFKSQRFQILQEVKEAQKEGNQKRMENLIERLQKISWEIVK